MNICGYNIDWRGTESIFDKIQLCLMLKYQRLGSLFSFGEVSFVFHQTSSFLLISTIVNLIPCRVLCN